MEAQRSSQYKLAIIDISIIIFYSFKKRIDVFFIL